MIPDFKVPALVPDESKFQKQLKWFAHYNRAAAAKRFNAGRKEIDYMINELKEGRLAEETWGNSERS